jgi:hypothetical protein
MKKIIGCILIASPFVAIFVHACMQNGVMVTLYSFALAFILFVVIATGVVLVNK